jgi:hypothetical protein
LPRIRNAWRIDRWPLSPRHKRGDISLIGSCNDEPSLDLSHKPDQPRDIVTVFEPPFSGIGAGIPISVLILITTPAPRPCC